MGTLKVDNLQKRDGTSLITDGVAQTNLLTETALRNAGVGMIKLNTTDVTSATATVTFDSSLITDTYDKYIMSYQALKPSTDTAQFRSRYSTDNGSTFETGNFTYGYHYSQMGAASTTGSGTTKTDYAESSFQSATDAGYPDAGVFHIDGLRDSSTKLTIRHEYIIQVAGDQQYVVQQAWAFPTTGITFNYIEWSFSSGNIADGTFTLYGLVK